MPGPSDLLRTVGTEGLPRAQVRPAVDVARAGFSRLR